MKNMMIVGLALLFALAFSGCNNEKPLPQEEEIPPPPTATYNYSHYMPTNTDNHWSYHTHYVYQYYQGGELQNETDVEYQVEYAVAGLISPQEPFPTQGDTWELIFTGPPDYSGLGFPDYINVVLDSVNLSGDGNTFDFLLADSMGIGEENQRGFFYEDSLEFTEYLSYSVEAGNYQDVMKFFREHINSNPDSSYHSIYSEFYAPDVGLIYASRSTYDHDYHGDYLSITLFTAELTDYEINPPQSTIGNVMN
jgi:hypothetical protein